MAHSTTRSTTVQAPIDRVWETIVAVEDYPQWADGITHVAVVSRDGDGLPHHVEFHIDAGPVKDSYVLAYSWDSVTGDERRVSWSLVTGAMFRDLTGGYRVVERGDAGIDVTYDLSVTMGMPMPSFMRKKAEQRIVDTALDGLRERLARGDSA